MASSVVIVLTKWGAISVNQQSKYYINWDFIRDAINNETYLVSIWVFKHIPDMLKGCTLLFKPHGVNNQHDVKLIIKKLEQYHDIEISPEKKEEIMASAEKMFKEKKGIFVKATIKKA